MRIFTTEEQELLRRIDSGEGRTLYDLIYPWMEGVSFEVNLEGNHASFILEKSPNSNMGEKLSEIQNIVIQSVNLIKLFEDHGYIFTFISVHQKVPDNFIFGRTGLDKPTEIHEFPDPGIARLFSEYSNREIFVTPELNKFISDGFISREEMRANRQYRLTRAILVISVIALLLNFAFNVYDEFFSEMEVKVTNPEALNSE